MRFLLVCAAFSVWYPATTRAAEELPLTALSFAYSARHSSLELSDKTVAALRPAEAISDFPGEADADLIARDNRWRVPRMLSRDDLCSTAASVAEANNLPVSFFANLIQQESGWKPHVISSAGAQGIAQFMPRTAQAYGLNNPFDPIHALAVSGKFLGELLQQFGNLGLAAAAYNAGPKRVQDWMAKRGRLPEETRNYVRSITGQPAERWAAEQLAFAEVRLPPHARCTDARTMEAQAIERAKPIETAALPSKKAIALARSSQKAFTLASADPDAKLGGTSVVAKTSGIKTSGIKISGAKTSGDKAFTDKAPGAKVPVAAKIAGVKTATIKGGNIVSISAGPAARRFAAMGTPAIMVPEKGTGRSRPAAQRAPVQSASAKPLNLKIATSSVKSANKSIAENTRGKAATGKRVKVAAAR